MKAMNNMKAIFHKPITLFALLLIAVLGCNSLVQAAPGSYPDRPIKLLLGFPPGGGSDIVARLIAKSLGDRLGVPVVVDNRPGAGGNIAAEIASKASPDGYTLLFMASAHATNAAIKKSQVFDPINDFSWIGLVTTYPLAMSVAPNSEFKSFAEFMKLAKANPDKYSYSSVGVGSAMHLFGEWMFSELGLTVKHIPFKGGTAPYTELAAGRVDLMIDTMTYSLALLKDAQVRIIATSAPKGRSPVMGVPTVSEFAPGVVYESWLGISGPPGMSKNMVDTLNAELKEVVNLPDVKQKLIEFGGTPQAVSPAQFRGRVEQDIVNFKKIVATNHINLE